MNPKNKKKLFTALLVLALCLMGAAFVMRDQWFSSRLGGTVMGIASGLTSISVVQLLVLREEQENPRIQKRNQIEQTDERNQAIRNRAKALSGNVLQWAVLAAGWVAFGLNAPAWVLLLATAVFISKGILDLCFTVHFQRTM